MARAITTANMIAAKSEAQALPLQKGAEWDRDQLILRKKTERRLDQNDKRDALMDRVDRWMNTSMRWKAMKAIVPLYIILTCVC